MVMIMSGELLSGTIQLAPAGPSEWHIAFFPDQNIVTGTSSFKEQAEILAYLEWLGVAESNAAAVSQMNFDQKELLPIEIKLTNVPQSLLRRLGLISN